MHQGSTTPNQPKDRPRIDPIHHLPQSVQKITQWIFAALLFSAFIFLLSWLVGHFRVLVVPLLVALLLAALLNPVFSAFCGKLKAPRWLSLIFTLITLFACVSVLIWLIFIAFKTGTVLTLTDIQDRYKNFLDTLQDLPIKVDKELLDSWFSQAIDWLKHNTSTLLESALKVTSSAASVGAGALLTIFVLIFYLLDGKRIWGFLIGFLPFKERELINRAGELAWVSVGHYVRVQVFVAFIDAFGVFLAALFLQVPYPIALGIIVFLAAFIPFIGAIVSGAIAVLVALVVNGIWNAIFMLLAVLAVMLIEAYVLQPLIMGKAVNIHPLAVVLAVSAGGMVAGIPGAIFAVPFVATINVMLRYILSHKKQNSNAATDSA